MISRLTKQRSRLVNHISFTQRALTTRVLPRSYNPNLYLPRNTLQLIPRRYSCFCSHSPSTEMSEPMSGGAQSKPSENDGEYRLPTSVTPVHYDLAYKTDLSSSPPSFSGEALVHLDINSQTSKVTFNVHHSLNITHIAVSTSELKSTSNHVLDLAKLKIDKEKERGTIDLGELPGGGLKADSKAKIWFRFESELGGSMMGYYKSIGDPDSETGVKPVYALTQFEATSARRAFPCWDEPMLKATFTVSMIAPEKQTVLNNMPEVSSKPWKASSSASPESALAEGYELGSLVDLVSTSGKTEGQSEGKTESSTSASWKITKFEKSPPMSTYLVAFACGEFEYLSSEHKSTTGKTVPLRIYAVKDQIKQAQFGLDIKKWALPIYEEIFDIPYALPKLDTLVAHDFDAGAMENWGLITGRTTAYLYDPEKSSLAAKKRVATVQCHELAHMWFGDIVTMNWWDNLWLNEAFATLMGELVVPDRIWPEWKVRSEFLNSHLTSALALDAVRSSHPIEVPIPDANQINQIFDSISYSKGASVLRMLSAVVGEEKFLKGVSLYLKKHVYSNAQTKDLWDGISETSGLDVAKIMANWTLKIGFPVISVEELGDGKVKVTQNRFLATGDVKPEEDETIWYVPLEVKTISSSGESTVDHKAVLNERSSTLDLGDASESFKLNAETVGVYRVSYSPERLAKLGKSAKHLSVEDRVGLVSDAATLARAGYAKTSGSLNLIAELGKAEDEFLPWSQISGALSKLVLAWWEQPEDVRKAINKLRLDLFKPVVDRMGYEHGKDDAPDVKELRELVISTVAAAEDPSVLAELKSRFEPFLSNNDDSRIPPDLQRTIYSCATRHGGIKEYEKILEVYNKPPNPSTKVDAMYALTTVKDEALLDRTFAMMTDGSVKDQDLYIFCFGLAANRVARRRNTKWVMDNYDMLCAKYSDSMGMSYIIKGGFTSLSSHEDLEMAKKFFDGKDISKFRLSVLQTFDAMQAAADWLSRDKKDVEEWLKENKYL